MNIFEINVLGFTIAPSYYGLMYALSFIIGYLIIRRRGYVKSILLDDLLFYIFLGVILGGRMGYVLFYNFSHYLSNLGDILKIWEGGMSFHGGVIGVVIAMYIFSKKKKLNFYLLSDEVTAVLPIGLGLGRLGNYLNKELLGYSPYNGFLAIEKNGTSYFPSPLLESLLEGLFLYIILLYFYKKRQFGGQIASLFLIVYGIFRLLVEIFFREPDSHIGYIYNYFTVGEILTLPMIMLGLGLYIYLRKKNNVPL
ncbi:prolipoprotein diacylglyceryl transferase [Candidatus Gracilibacteria bacterium 28_42_T64]|nr:prolipoprotein diacylglyceryl transferase [Candidatus Gracilibacteria bacterium 28_42_T64]